MPRKKIVIGDGIPSPSSEHQVQKTIFLVRSGTTATSYEYDFMDGSLTYFETTITQSFEYLLVDNIGDGSVRIAFNKKGMDLSSSIDGAKTLKAGDVLYIQDSVRQIGIYFIEDSIVELALMSK